MISAPLPARLSCGGWADPCDGCDKCDGPIHGGTRVWHEVSGPGHVGTVKRVDGQFAWIGWDNGSVGSHAIASLRVKAPDLRAAAEAVINAATFPHVGGVPPGPLCLSVSVPAALIDTLRAALKEAK